MRKEQWIYRWTGEAHVKQPNKIGSGSYLETVFERLNTRSYPMTKNLILVLKDIMVLSGRGLTC